VGRSEVGSWRDPLADVNDPAGEFGKKVFGVLENRRRRDLFVPSIHDRQALAAKDLQHT
jgi:hypothetical protein